MVVGMEKAMVDMEVAVMVVLVLIGQLLPMVVEGALMEDMVAVNLADMEYMVAAAV